MALRWAESGYHHDGVAPIMFRCRINPTVWCKNVTRQASRKLKLVLIYFAHVASFIFQEKMRFVYCVMALCSVCACCMTIATVDTLTMGCMIFQRKADIMNGWNRIRFRFDFRKRSFVWNVKEWTNVFWKSKKILFKIYLFLFLVVSFWSYYLKKHICVLKILKLYTLFKNLR